MQSVAQFSIEVPDKGLVVEISRLHNKGIALPVTAGIASVLPNSLRHMGTTVQRNKANVMDMFLENSHVVRRLDYVVVVVISSWEGRDPTIPETAVTQVERLPRIHRTPPPAHVGNPSRLG